MSKLTKSAPWKALDAHRQEISGTHMRDWFAEDPNRFDRFSLSACGILLDYSKNRMTDKTLSLLFDLARDVDIEGWRKRMFQGDAINNTEERAVLHIALRNPEKTPVMVDGENIMPGIHDVLDRMGDFADQVRDGSWIGATGKRITDVVNIGVGGSDLGPHMVIQAMSAYVTKDIEFHFVSNIDGVHVQNALSKVNWETTLFIICSKSFTTPETMMNAATVRQWFLDNGGAEDQVGKHFVAATANRAAAKEFGISPPLTFELWDWVGGRFSLWSAVGLSIVIALGRGGFDKLLSGAHAMDKHFVDAPLEQNMPVIMAMLRLWYANFFDADSYALIPFSQNLRHLPEYFQQGDMESNGKETDRDGNRVDYTTAPITWGKAGTDCQHSFFQRLHQGTGFLPIDFLASANSDAPTEGHHDVLLSNFIAQTEALMLGKTEAQVRIELTARGITGDAQEALVPHKIFDGNRPTNAIVYQQLDPETLGALIVLYEHITFVQGIVWNVNSFDQWGVEFGKELANRILPQLKAGHDANEHDSSTNGLINFMRNWRN